MVMQLQLFFELLATATGAPDCTVPEKPFAPVCIDIDLYSLLSTIRLPGYLLFNRKPTTDIQWLVGTKLM